MVMLANYWDESLDPTGWIISEKLDGHRAHWQSPTLLTRNNKTYLAPEWFTKDLPKTHQLDGELWAGRQNRVAVSSLGKNPFAWKQVVFAVFDIPDLNLPFEARLERLQKISGEYMYCIPFEICTGKEHLLRLLDKTVAEGGEGLMIRKPGSFYENKRSDTLLKVKIWHYDTAVITGYEAGKIQGMTGCLLVVDERGLHFKIGTGLDDKIRRNPPKIGTELKFRYHEKTQKGIPETPVFLHTI